MPSKRPIKAFVIPKTVPKRSTSQTSASSLISTNSDILPSSPSFTVIDTIHSPVLKSTSPFGRISQLSNLSQRETSWNASLQEASQYPSLAREDIESEEDDDDHDHRKTCIFIIIGLVIAAGLIAVVALLGVMLSNKNTSNI